MKMKPLRIEWKLNRPMVNSDIPIHFDSILAWAAVQEEFGKDADNPYAVIDRLPLAKHKMGFYEASMLVIEPTISGLQVDTMTKPFEIDVLAGGMDVYFQTKRKKNYFNNASGPQKAFDLRVLSRWTNKVQAWCIGDMKQIEHLLTRVRALGKLAKNGYGHIESFDVQEDEAAAHLYKLRCLPLSDPGAKVSPGYAKVFASFTPPYWKRDKFQVCEIPVNPHLMIQNCEPCENN